MSDAVLIVDDDPVQRRLLEATVTRFGYTPKLVEGGEAALEAIAGEEPGEIRAVILDLVMPGMDGIEVLERLRFEGCPTPVIVQTAKGGIETVVAAMRAGAFDFVVKPVSAERLRTALSNAIRVRSLESEVKQARAPGGSGFSFKNIVTRSPAMERAIRLGQKAAASDIPILIEGESGVGKELFARAIQASGPRRARPFVTVNCGAIPDNLVESILFGHEKGAFTGATERHPGKFVEANGGTLFLDEVGDLPLDVQVKLLRAVQDGEVDPVGGRGTARVDIRVISATNRDLLQRVRDSRFREDLFYRLNVFPILVPPLRERREDIALLVQHFIGRFANESRPIAGISARALDLLAAYDWPGNVRQLENAVFRAMVLCEGEVLTLEDFPQIRAQVEGIDEALVEPDGGDPAAATATAVDPMPAGERASEDLLHMLDERGELRRLGDVEAELVRFAVRHYRGRMSEVARRLGIGRSTLYRKLKDIGIDPNAGRSDRSP